MFKKKFFSFGVLIALIIACVVLFAILFVLSTVPAVNNPAAGSGITNGAEDVTSEEDLPAPAVFEWEMPIVVSITGSDSDKGLAAAWGFDYGIKAVNELGGIRGLPVSLSVRDTASSNTGVTTEFETLVPDSLVIMGPPIETAFKAGEHIFYNAGVPAVGAAIDAKNRDAFQPFAISCITDPGITAGSAVATWVRIERFTTVCVLYSPISDERVEYIEAALAATGKQIVEIIEIGNEAFDAATISDKAYSSGADAFYIDMNGEDTLRIVAQLKYIAGENAVNLRILCGPLAADKELIESAKEGDMYGVRVWTTVDPSKDVEKRKAFDEAFDKNIGDPMHRDLAVDYYQSAHMLKQAIESLALTSDPSSFKGERLMLANWLYNSELIKTEHGDFLIVEGGKSIEAKLFRITEKGLQ